MISFTKREQIVILLLIVLVVIISLFSYFKGDVGGHKVPQDEIDNDEIDSNDLADNYDDERKDLDGENNVDNSYIMVHISGQVSKPGIVELEQGSRLIDAVEMAGGLEEEADLDKINLAKILEDEEKIYIPKIGEEGLDDNLQLSEDDGKVNINDAPKEELITLPGVGDALADRIIQYREENKFNSIEDIQNVSGIGPKKFEGIKDLIKVK